MIMVRNMYPMWVSLFRFWKRSGKDAHYLTMRRLAHVYGQDFPAENWAIYADRIEAMAQY